MAHSAEQWVSRFASLLGTEAPSAGEREDLLALAGVAAHASERVAAPLSCWLVARAGADPDRELELARQLSAELDSGG